MLIVFLIIPDNCGCQNTNHREIKSKIRNDRLLIYVGMIYLH